MNLLRTSLLAAAGAVLISTTPAIAQQKTGDLSIPVEAWALRDVMTNVEISPNGKNLLLMKVESKEGEYIMQIYDATDFSKKPFTTNADPMEIIGASFVDDRFIFGRAWQVKRKSVKGPEEDVRDYLAFSFDLETKKFSKVSGNFSIVNTLPNDPDNVLIASGRPNDGGVGVDPFAAFRPRSYYKFNLKTGGRSLVLKGNDKYPTAEFDDDGNPRFTTGQDQTTNEQIFYYRAVGDKSWKEFGERYDLDEHKNLYRRLGRFQGFAGVSAEDPDKGYFIDNRDGDKAALYSFDFKTGQIGEKLFSTPDADVMGLQRSSMWRAGDNSVVAARYPGAKMERHWFDMEEKELFENLEREIPYSHAIRITSRSVDGNTMVVYNSGPRDPGSYWLIKNERMTKIGSRNPTIDQTKLSDVEFIKYPARDGKIIPGYVTKPAGEGPFPLIVLPHGGPHVNEIIGYDEWGQLLANAGYMVLQPQYRMTVGWGQEHFDGGYGEHGGAMQDDKDDGAMYLVEKGLVDPDRIAMFGWSYGGYAALVATTREEQIYQCAIAGAAVADPAKSFRSNNFAGVPTALKDWAERRGTIGINPINEVEKSNIPLLMVHGDVDARVLYYHYKDYKKAMDAAGKPAQYLTLKGADHFYATLMYNHQETFFTKMLDFLKNDCGPNGL
ncbi:S9 family peptidase [Altererythrobacter sp. RZ02]|uniref:S9 family peptidase n=1 Tax=Pontixanthobacter rizhaonensis TaxID=2730337 RepID=A0A848QNH6_9SPHN|nr:prolyl oligopeptidase family serine peptidase [Pontixanthobacter rizhaonensis]NMW31106.1 S9 family peptidase [Pontixanthobacter rizhaonensis]